VIEDVFTFETINTSEINVLYLTAQSIRESQSQNRWYSIRSIDVLLVDVYFKFANQVRRDQVQMSPANHITTLRWSGRRRVRHRATLPIQQILKSVRRALRVRSWLPCPFSSFSELFDRCWLNRLIGFLSDEGNLTIYFVIDYDS